MKNSFTPCNTCRIAALSLCKSTSCSNQKGRGFDASSLTAIERESIKDDYKHHGCPYKN